MATTVFFNVFIIKTVGKGHGSTLRPLFLIGVWHIKQKRRAWLRWVYNLLGGFKWQNDTCKSGIVLCLYLLEQCLDPMCRTLIKTCNFVTFKKNLINLGVHLTVRGWKTDMAEGKLWVPCAFPWRYMQLLCNNLLVFGGALLIFCHRPCKFSKWCHYDR